MIAKNKPTIYYGWRIVGATFLLAVFGWGLGFYGPPIYLYAIHEARGWSTSFVSGAISSHFLFGALAVANLPKLYRWMGVARTTTLGSICLGFGIAGWAFASAPWELYLATLVSGVGWAATGPAAVNAILTPWFVKSRPAALSSAYNGASAAGVIFSPLWVALIGAVGFRSASMMIAVLTVIAVAALSYFYFARRPEEMGFCPDGEVFQATASPLTAPPAGAADLRSDLRFLTLASGMALGLFAQIGLLSQLFSLLAPALGPQLAGLAAAASTTAAIFGRTLIGWLMPPSADRRVIACLSYAVQITGSLTFIMSSGRDASLLFLAVVLFGLGIGNATSLPPLIAQAEFRREDVSRVVPLIVAVSQAAYAFAPATFGLLRELEFGGIRDASPVFVTAATIQALAVTVFLVGRKRRRDPA